MHTKPILKLIGLMVILALVLAACANTPADEGTPAVVDTPAAEMTPDPVETPVEEPTPVVDETPVDVETPDVDETPVVEETPGEIPETGPDPLEQGQQIIDHETMVFASNVLGATLLDVNGETVGEITDLAYDQHTSNVIYAIVSPEGESDAAPGRQTAYPWHMTGSGEMLDGETPAETEEGSNVPDTLVFNGDPQDLQNAPSMETDGLAEADFALWSEELYYHWREADESFHVVGVTETTVLFLVSGLTNLEAIHGDTGETYTARDLVMDLATGNILFIVLEAGELFPGESGLVLVPFDYLNYGPMEDGTHGFVFNADEEMLQTLPRLNDNDIPGDLSQ
jgi:sporulation protein YlmC with PRC-barrel domain